MMKREPEPQHISIQNIKRDALRVDKLLKNKILHRRMHSTKEHLEAEENVMENDLVQITLRHVLFGFPLIFAIKDVDAIDPPFNNSFIIKVGSGSNTLFWKDQWCCSGNRLMDIFPRFYALDTFKDCKVSDHWGLFTGIGGERGARRRYGKIENSIVSITDTLMGNVKTNGYGRTNKVLNEVLNCAIWSIWKWRNKVSYVNPELVFSIIEEDIFPFIQRMSKTGFQLVSSRVRRTGAIGPQDL
ncbi:hypothetical protein Tco_0654492 [Tanacetum coccineum]|uniref:Uncharacterized protein n=1 Tax=Tanacetum coccineum TaxID=301880 RepID=A0ABQ4X3V4_9ASTR